MTDTTTAASRTDPVTAFLAADKKRAGLLFLVFALLWAVPAGYCAFKAVKGWGSPAPVKDEKKDKDPTAPPEGEEPPPAPTDPNLGNYVVAAAGGFLGALAAAAAGLALLVALPAFTPGAEQTRMRTAVLAVGVASGVLLMLLGLWFFVADFETLTKWLDRGESKDVWKVLAALLVFVLGAGLAFLAAQPARAEERHNQLLRQMVYGSNLAVTVLLVVLLLVAGNVIAGSKLPNKLDVTEAGFYSLQKPTEDFVRTLDQKVTVYVLFPEEGPRYADMRRLLVAASDLNPDKFVLRYPSQFSTAEILRLKTKFPQADLEDLGMIVAVGDDESRYSYIRTSEFVKDEGGGRMGGESKPFFQGEQRLVKELRFLAENKTKPVVYVTQGNGELALNPNPDEPAGPARSMGMVKAYLEKNNIDVRPLAFDLKAAKVPDDATLVIVADPQSGLSPEAAGAIEKYLDTPKADGKKGKLFALLGPHMAAGNKEVQKTGLEGLLAKFNIQPRAGFLYTQPTSRQPPEYVIFGASRSAVSARIPMATVLKELDYMPNCRVIDVVRQGANPQVQATPLLVTASGPVTWIEPAKSSDPTRAFEDLVASIQTEGQELAKRKQATNGSRVVAAVASEGGAGRVIVVGSGAWFADDYARQAGDANPAGQVLATGIDWLRERPEGSDVTARPFEFYTLPADFNGTRMYTLPLLLSVLALAALGAGVWVVRRK